jgi:hypothetical protein
MQETVKSAYTVKVVSETAVTLTISHTEIKSIMAKFLPLGDPKLDIAASQILQTALRRCQWFSRLPEDTLKALVECMESAVYNTGDLISPAGSADSKMYYIARGAALSTKVNICNLA